MSEIAALPSYFTNLHSLMHDTFDKRKGLAGVWQGNYQERPSAVGDNGLLLGRAKVHGESPMSEAI